MKVLAAGDSNCARTCGAESLARAGAKLRYGTGPYTIVPLAGEDAPEPVAGSDECRPLHVQDAPLAARAP